MIIDGLVDYAPLLYNVSNDAPIAGFWDNFQLEVFGDASKMGKVIATAPTLKSVAMEGGFSANLNATLQSTPPGLTGPFHVAKKFIR